MTGGKRTAELELTIRSMNEADLAAVVAIEKEVFPDPWPRRSFEEAMTERHWRTIVSLCGEKLIGYACWLVVDVESHLTNIAVTGPYRRKSVAKRLLDHILRDVTEAGCEYLLLEVRPSNIGAIAFYKKHGFELMYRRPHYYRRPAEDALVLVRYLDRDETKD